MLPFCLLQFYNSYCGHCRRFAPVYSELAANLSLWSPDILQVTALDCSVDENSDICREFEVMAYPTVRLFLPNTKAGVNKTLGIDIGISPKNIVEAVTRNITELKNPPDHWPSFEFFAGRKEELFDGVDDEVKFILLFYEKNNSLVGPQIILDLHKVKAIEIKRIDNTSLASELGLGASSRVMAMNRGLTPVELGVGESATSALILKVITNFLKAQNIPMAAEITRPHEEATESSVSEIAEVMEAQQDEAIRTKVKANLGKRISSIDCQNTPTVI